MKIWTPSITLSAEKKEDVRNDEAHRIDDDDVCRDRS